MKDLHNSSHKGFTLVEMMIVVAIISILAAIALPIYSKYVRKSRTSEAINNLSAIAMYEETYLSENDSYVTAGPNPVSVPNASDTGGRLAFSSGVTGWNLLGRIIPNGTPLYFQYEVRAGQYNSGTGYNTGGTGALVSPDTTRIPGSTGLSDHVCNPALTAYSASNLSIPNTPSSNWFYATAVGNQKANGSLRKCSLFIKVIDRPDTFIVDDIE